MISDFNSIADFTLDGAPSRFDLLRSILAEAGLPFEQTWLER